MGDQPGGTATRAGLNGLGLIGAAFVVYGTIREVAQSADGQLHIDAEALSAFVAVCAVILSTASVYARWDTSNPPAAVSRIVTAPLVVLFCCSTIVLMACKGHIPAASVNGLTILGLAGGLLRLQPKPPGWRA
jgi:hypothetical protein